MAATSEKKTKSSFYVTVVKEHYRGFFKVRPQETIAVLKQRIINFVNSNTVPDISVLLTMDNFELRNNKVHDILIEDSALIGDYFKYKFVTEELVVVMRDADGNTMPIVEAVAGSANHYTAAQGKEIMEKFEPIIQSTYEALLKE